ncbi:MFS transporter [Cyanobacterium aponinum]|uniref:MFS transporter n=1 Tax=Cyanobacterium aponinum 0216 TaxID=2676140 RepID=A0A844GSL4_9CHRO|nr:MFS transporter [Cyanobacterium aponinum 0216]
MSFINTFKAVERDKLVNLFILFFCALFFWMSLTSLIPTLPSYLQNIGATVKQVGYIMGCFAIGLLLSRVWLGKLADEGLQKFINYLPFPSGINNFILRFFRRFLGKLVYYPSRKVVIIIGTIVAFIAPLGYLFFDSLSELMINRAFHGVSIAAFTTGYSALVVDLSPPKQKGELIGYMSLAVPIGMAIGPAMGGFLEVYTSYEFLFLLSASCGLMALILACQIRELDSQVDKNQNISVSGEILSKESLINRDFKELIFSASFAVPALVLLLIGCLFGTLVTFLPLYIRDLGLNFNVGFFYTAAAIASFAVRFLSGRASDKYGRGLFISGSLICYILSMIFLTFVQDNMMLILSAILEGIGAGVLVPITLALISDRCSAIERGKVFAVCVSGFDVGVALGGPVLGSLILDFGYRVLFGVTALMAIAALLIFIGFSNKNITNSWKFAWGISNDLYAVK